MNAEKWQVGRWVACLGVLGAAWLLAVAGCGGARQGAVPAEPATAEDPGAAAAEGSSAAEVAEAEARGEAQGASEDDGDWVEVEGEGLEELGEIVIDGRYIEIDGQEVRHLTCELSDAGGLALLEVVAALAAAKPGLDACVPGGGAVRVELRLGTQTVARVLESSASSANACVEGVLAGVSAPLEGRCAMVLVLGDRDGARPAADAMAPLEPDATE